MASLVASAASAVDEEISIKHLLAKHRSEIDKLKLLVPPPPAVGEDGVPWDGMACKYDDLFYLRYALSFPKDEKSATEALKFTFDFRSSPDHRERIKIVSTGQVKTHPLTEESKKWNVAGALGVDDDGNRTSRGVLKESTGQGFVIVVRIAMCKRDDMSNSLTFDEQKSLQLLHREAGFQYVDKLTRETGLLSKQVMFFDLKGAALSSMNDKKSRHIQAEVSNIGKKCYPQLVDKVAMVNAPKWFAGLLKVLKAVLPKSALEKIELFSSTESLWDSDWAKQRLKRENMPGFLGGQLPEEELSDELAGKCLERTSLPDVTIKPRGKVSVPIDITSDGKHQVNYLVSITNRGVTFSIVFVPKGMESRAKEAVTLRSENKIEASKGPIRDTITVNGPGTVHFKFDNSHSMMREKIVKYLISAKPAES